MVVAAKLTEWAILIGAIGVFITAAAGAVVQVLVAVNTSRKVDAVHDVAARAVRELETLNGSTVGELADADESRRISAIEPADRTPGEIEHVAIVPPASPER